MVAINAAEFLQWGFSANRAIQHYEHTSRKVDMSAAGGPSSTAAGNELRRRVAARMTDNNEEDPFMALTDAEQKELLDAVRWLKNQLAGGTAPGQKTAGTTIAATLNQAQANYNAINKIPH
jgi:hypothetical protein